MCIAAMLIIALIWGIWTILKIEKPEPFKKGEYGILVAGFKEKAKHPEHTGESLQDTIESSLNARFRNCDTKVRSIEISCIPFFNIIKSHEAAREKGKKYQAELVIWGEINDTEVILNITVINPSSGIVVTESEIIIKEHLGREDMDKLVAFVNGLKYYHKDDYENALQYFQNSFPNEKVVPFYIGNIFLFKKNYTEAIDNYDKALKISLDYTKAYNNKGLAYRNKGEYDKAIEAYDKAIRINPNLEGAYCNRGDAYCLKGKYDKAIENYKQAINIIQKRYVNTLIDPKYALAYCNFAWILGTCPEDKYRDGTKAVELAQKALELNPKWGNRDTLAAAYAEAGNFNEAISAQEKAIELLNKEGSPAEIDKNSKGCNDRLEYYKARKPWRETKPSEP